MIYLDNSATTRPTEPVRAAVCDAMMEGFFNPSALYAPALQAEKKMRACREEILSRLRFAGVIAHTRDLGREICRAGQNLYIFE